ncbi:MAG: PH domain-containing protein [Proteobacteria bacterium]|nr:PH domain-containing protein [Pseudomonadota bacterium]
MWPRVVGALVLTTLLSVGIVVAALLVPAWWLMAALPVVWLFLLLPMLYGAHVAYTKERYEIHANHLVCHRGGLLSDGRTELELRNVTHVRLRLPWLRHRFFKIGDVRIESAGSAASEITFEAIQNPVDVYEQVQELMRANGYSMKRAEVLHEESPTAMGAVTDIVKTVFGVAFTMIWLFGATFGLTMGIIESAGPVAGGVVSVLGIGFAGGSVLLTLAGLVVRYLDLTRRTYTVYDDTVSYTEGFLTRDNAFIPYENIADAAINRTFIDQMLGLYDVSVSCQGSGSEIHFRRLSRGPELKEAIATLVANASAITVKPGEVAEAATPEGEDEAEAKPVAKAVQKRELVSADDAWTGEFKMNVARSLVPLLASILVPPAWLIATIGMFIKASNTTYTVGTHSMSSEYNFLGTKQQEFAYDKVTGVQVSRSPLDDFFKTLTVQIWSIGSPQPLTFSNVAVDDIDLGALLRQCGIDEDEVQGELKQSFGPKVWLIQNAFLLIFLAMVAAALLVAAVAFWPVLLLIPVLLLLPAPMAAITAMRVKKQRITFHGQHIEAQTGIFFKQHIYARYDNIKKVETTAIPFTEQGRFKVYIAGERVMQQQGQQAQQPGGGIKVPYALEGAYIEDIAIKVGAMDALLLGLIEPSAIEEEHPQNDDVLTTTKPAIPNAVAPFLIFPPLWPFAPLVAWQTHVAQYEIETDRVVMRRGIFFKSVTSVLFNRIDSIQQNQGALGKAFGNGQVTILTAGSSAPDLTVANVPDYAEVYDTIRKNYGKG